MPLKHGTKTRTIAANISKNIATERHAGRSQKQSVAIAMSTARQDARKAHVKAPAAVKRGRK